MLTIKAGNKSWYSGKRMWVEKKRDCFKIFVYPGHYWLFAKRVQTSIERKKYLISFSAEVIRRKQSYLDEIRNREDWWTILQKMQKGIEEI